MTVNTDVNVSQVNYKNKSSVPPTHMPNLRLYQKQNKNKLTRNLLSVLENIVQSPHILIKIADQPFLGQMRGSGQTTALKATNKRLNRSKNTTNTPG